MRGKILAVLFLASATLLAAAADGVQPPPAPPAPTPVKPSITFPVAPTPPPPAPPAPSPAPAPSPVLPNAVQVLAADTLYVVASDEPFLFFVEPDDASAPLVKVTRESGPLKIRGKFIDGKDVETRTYAAKYLVIVEAVPGATGRVAMIAFPVGAKDESAAVRQRIDVNQGAKPPPDKIPDPKPVPPDADPKPDPKPTPVVGDLWVVIVEELDDRTVATAKIVNDSAFWLDQAKRGVKMRTYDKDEPAAVNKGYVKAAGKVGLPAVLLLDADGDVVRAKAMPKDVAGMAAIIAEVRP